MIHPVRSGLALALAALLFAGCSSPAPTASSSSTDGATSSAIRSPERPLPQSPTSARGFTAAVEAGTRTNEGRPGSAYWQQDVEYNLTARLYPADKRLDGTGQITYTNNSPDTLHHLHLELAQNVHKPGVVRNEPMDITGGVDIERVAVDGQSLPADADDDPRYATSNTQLVLTPSAPLAPGARTTIEIDWSFTIPQAGAGARMGYNGHDLLFLAYWYPIMSVYDDVVGWMDDPFLGTAEFYADFASYDLTIEAPEGWIVQATGSLQNPSDVLNDATLDRRSRAYRSDDPVRILLPDQTGTRSSEDGRLRWQFRAERVRDVAFSLTRNMYWEGARTEAGDRDGDGQMNYTHINTFWRASAPKWSKVTRYQQHAITFFAEHMDFPYPWPHMTAVEGGGIIGGGMEFPMMTLMGDYNNNTARMLYAVTAHELAHMWVPMIVSTNERRYSWIDEGTTSFNENMARKGRFADSESVESDRQDYLEIAGDDAEGEMMRWSNYYYTGTAFVNAAYRKPATMLVALRAVLGEDTFERAHHDFVDTWAYKHPYPSDFFNTFERVSGRDLDWFWYSWYYTTWTLDQAVAEVQRMDDGTTRIAITDEGHAPMPVRLTITRTDGSTLTRTIPVDVWLEGRTATSVTVPSGPAVERVAIDAQHHFPDIDRADNVWTRSGQPASSN